MCSYFIHFADTPEEKNLTTQSILIGDTEGIIDHPKNAEATRIQEVFLYLKIRKKLDGIVKDQLSKCMEDIASHFEGTHRNLEKLVS